MGKSVMFGGPGVARIYWGHFGGMLMLIAGTVGFWLLVFKKVKREHRRRG